jgi:hypothetical protein
MVEDLIKRPDQVEYAMRELSVAFIDATVHAQAALALVKYVRGLESVTAAQAARITALESERDALLAEAGKEAVVVGWAIREKHFPDRLLFSHETGEEPSEQDRDWLTKQGHEYVPLYTAPTADLENGGGRDAWLLTLYELLMQQNIVTSGESYLSLRCVGVPPTEAEFATAVQRAIDAALANQKQAG